MHCAMKQCLPKPSIASQCLLPAFLSASHESQRKFFPWLTVSTLTKVHKCTRPLPAAIWRSRTTFKTVHSDISAMPVSSVQSKNNLITLKPTLDALKLPPLRQQSLTLLKFPIPQKLARSLERSPYPHQEARQIQRGRCRSRSTISASLSSTWLKVETARVAISSSAMHLRGTKHRLRQAGPLQPRQCSHCKRRNSERCRERSDCPCQQPMVKVNPRKPLPCPNLPAWRMEKNENGQRSRQRTKPSSKTLCATRTAGG